MADNFYIVFSNTHKFNFFFGNGNEWNQIPGLCELDVESQSDYLRGEAFKRFSPVDLPDSEEYYLVDRLFKMEMLPDEKGIEYEALFQHGQLVYLRQKEYTRCNLSSNGYSLQVPLNSPNIS